MEEENLIAPFDYYTLIQLIYGIDIDYRARIKGGCCTVHGVGLVIGQGAVIGENSKLYHGVL